jgi:hypothetical protein
MTNAGSVVSRSSVKDVTAIVQFLQNILQPATTYSAYVQLARQYNDLACALSASQLKKHPLMHTSLLDPLTAQDKKQVQAAAATLIDAYGWRTRSTHIGADLWTVNISPLADATLAFPLIADIYTASKGDHARVAHRLLTYPEALLWDLQHLPRIDE